MVVYKTRRYLRTRNGDAKTSLPCRPAVFFDCDGVLNVDLRDRGVLKPDDLMLLPEAAEAVRAVNNAGLLAVVVTNRAQLAKGTIDQNTLDAVFNRLEVLLAEGGAELDGIYFCPHLPPSELSSEAAGLNVACDCRKPRPGLLQEAAAELPIDLRHSSLIGDSVCDIGAARALNIYACGVRTGYGCQDVQRYPEGVAPQPDLMFDTAMEAVQFLLSNSRGHYT